MAASGFARAPLAADVPTAREQGVDLGLTGWQALAAPAGMPRPIVGRLNAEIHRALANPEVARRIRTQGDERAHSSPEKLYDLIAAVSKRVGRVVRDAGITVD